ncbi:CocE/NonD family hydrolase [Marinobacter shengliensis]|uniref:CocE/NonD family hydrolase n=1 Tax=Marinobacter shengliensis TaxID=1389223 RepID=UPI001107F5EC|nr:CocE/NonD family hydrolase [Marinobacter shengliensis]
MNKYNLRFALVITFSLALVGCGGASEDEALSAPASQTDPSTNAPEAEVEHPDTVREIMALGSRNAQSRHVPVVTEGASQWQPYDRPPTHTHAVSLPNQTIEMSDGTKLFVKATLPGFSSETAAPGSFPVVLTQTSYNTSVGQFVPEVGGANEYLVTRGYAHVVVDVRGTGNSGGNWEAFGEREQADYREVVDWVVDQPWALPSIGVEGISYLGITSILTSQQNHPAVKASFPIVPIGDGYRDIVFTGGNVNATFIPSWMALVTGLGLLPVELLPTDPTAFAQAIPERLTGALLDFQVPTILKALLGEEETVFDEGFWEVRSPMEGVDKINVPTFIVGGLFDLFQRSEPLWYERLVGRVPVKLLIGPWTHIEAAGIPDDGLPRDGVPPLDQIRLQWFDQYVMELDAGAQDQPNVTQFVLGLDQYQTATHWPHPELRAERAFLGTDGELTFTPPAESGTFEAFQQPLNGLCSFSTTQWTAGLTGLLPLPCLEDNRASELAAIKFELPATEQGIYINGPMQADLWVSSTAADVQLSVRLDLVNPDGSTRPITNGLLTASMNSVDESRSRYVNGEMIQPWHTFSAADRSSLERGEVRKVSVEIFPSSAFVPLGSALRVSINTSNVAQGVPPILTSLIPSLLGVMTLHTGPDTPSSLVLPVVPVEALSQ